MQEAKLYPSDLSVKQVHMDGCMCVGRGWGGVGPGRGENYIGWSTTDAGVEKAAVGADVSRRTVYRSV